MASSWNTLGGPSAPGEIRTVVDEVSTALTYVGMSAWDVPGTGSTWALFRVVTSGSVTVLEAPTAGISAKGSLRFNQTWANRASTGITWTTVS